MWRVASDTGERGIRDYSEVSSLCDRKESKAITTKKI